MEVHVGYWPKPRSAENDDPNKAAHISHFIVIANNLGPSSYADGSGCPRDLATSTMFQ